MQYCKRCLYPANHPLRLTFDRDGICSGCRIHEEKDAIDWKKREEKLRKILDAFRNKDGKNYDCIVPVSGARDSYFIVHILKNVYHMHPLLVTYNKHYNTKIGIRNLAYLKTLFGCDLFTMTVAPETVKKITKKTIKDLGSIYWHCLAGQTVFPVQIAVRFKIPLVIWGVHQGVDQVGMFSHLDEVEMTRRARKNHDLMGKEAEDLIDEKNGITEQDIRPYMYPHDKEIEKVGVRGIYLSNYIRWDSKKQHEEMIKLYNYKTVSQRRTFDTYNDSDCFHYSDLHDYIKFLKWGYGKVTDHASREIRLKRFTREEGIAMVKKYQSLLLNQKNLTIFLQWLGMNKKDFFKYIDAKRDPRIWQKTKDGKWKLFDSVVNHITDAGVDRARLNKKRSLDNRVRHATEQDGKFIINANGQYKENGYILIGRGWESA